jgi:hypothetical protein
MVTYPYLKDFVQTNIPLVVRIVKRVGQYPETDFNTKQPTGRMQTLYNFELPTGETVRHYGKEREEETLSMFSAGESVQVTRQEANKDGKRYTFLVWTPTEGAEQRLAANPPLKSNTQQTATQREMKDREDENIARDFKLGLAGVVQAMIAAGCSDDEITTGIERKRKTAPEWVTWIRQTAHEMASESAL